MLIFFKISLVIMSLALIVCAYFTSKSEKPVKPILIKLLLSALIPMVANLVIVYAQSRTEYAIGYMFYISGTNLVLYYLLRFMHNYPAPSFNEQYSGWKFIYIFLLVDTVSIFLNPFFGHVFGVKDAASDAAVPYIFYSCWWHYIHLVLSFVVVLGVVGVFTYRMIIQSKIYMVRYIYIIISLAVVLIWEFYCIFAAFPADFSMLGYGICGVLVYYFSIVFNHDLLEGAMLSVVVSSMDDGIFFFDVNGRCIYANKSAWDILDLKRGSYNKVFKKFDEILKDRTLKDRLEFECVRKVSAPSGEKVIRIECRKLNDDKDKLEGVYINVSDRTKEARQHEKARYHATHDSLTGIYNASHFYEEVEKRLIEDPDTEYIAIGSDIRNFKMINDIFGSDIGNDILITIAKTLDSYARGKAIYGRIGGDRFGMLMVKSHLNPKLFIEQTGNLSFMTDNNPYRVVIHMGVYEVTDRTISPSIMFDRALMAIKDIKDDLQVRIAFYDAKMRDNAIFEQKIIGSLDKGIDEEQIVPYLQPQMDDQGQLVGAEVLVRWFHPTENFMAPGKFIPILEKNGTIVRVDRYMWECACKILKKWEDRGIEDIYLSVNISPKDFYFMDVYKVLTELVEKYKLEPEKLRLEITETVIMDDANSTIDVIRRLRKYGFIIEMDDFGSGYSSLNMLKDMPIDILKLDMLFLGDTENPERGQTIVEFVIKLAIKLGLPLVAEGVETEEMVMSLQEMGCSYFQGYYFSKPISEDDFEEKYLKDR